MTSENFLDTHIDIYTQLVLSHKFFLWKVCVWMDWIFISQINFSMCWENYWYLREFNGKLIFYVKNSLCNKNKLHFFCFLQLLFYTLYLVCVHFPYMMNGFLKIICQSIFPQICNHWILRYILEIIFHNDKKSGLWKSLKYVRLINKWVDQKIMVHLHNGILCIREKEGAPTPCDSMDGTGEHYAKWNKPGGEGQIPYDLTFN